MTELNRRTRNWQHRPGAFLENVDVKTESITNLTGRNIIRFTSPNFLTEPHTSAKGSSSQTVTSHLEFIPRHMDLEESDIESINASTKGSCLLSERHKPHHAEHGSTGLSRSTFVCIFWQCSRSKVYNTGKAFIDYAAQPKILGFWVNKVLSFFYNAQLARKSALFVLNMAKQISIRPFLIHSLCVVDIFPIIK